MNTEGRLSFINAPLNKWSLVEQNSCLCLPHDLNEAEMTLLCKIVENEKSRIRTLEITTDCFDDREKFHVLLGIAERFLAG